MPRAERPCPTAASRRRNAVRGHLQRRSGASLRLGPELRRPPPGPLGGEVPTPRVSLPCPVLGRPVPAGRGLSGRERGSHSTPGKPLSCRPGAGGGGAGPGPRPLDPLPSEPELGPAPRPVPCVSGLWKAASLTSSTFLESDRNFLEEGKRIWFLEHSHFFTQMPLAQMHAKAGASVVSAGHRPPSGRPLAGEPSAGSALPGEPSSRHRGAACSLTPVLSLLDPGPNSLEAGQEGWEGPWALPGDSVML